MYHPYHRNCLVSKLTLLNTCTYKSLIRLNILWYRICTHSLAFTSFTENTKCTTVSPIKTKKNCFIPILLFIPKLCLDGYVHVNFVRVHVGFICTMQSVRPYQLAALIWSFVIFKIAWRCAYCQAFIFGQKQQK